MEKVIKEQLEEYMSVFERNFSCETTVNYLINRWKFIGKKKN